MSDKKILFATDLSASTNVGLQKAENLAKALGATLVILHVEEPWLEAFGQSYRGTPEPTTEALDKCLHELKPSDGSVRVEYRLKKGDPAKRIVETAAEEDAEMIIMGTHGRSGFVRYLLGSVAEGVIRHARCSVLTYPVSTLVAPHSQQPTAGQEPVR
jgi:nucleotide-binding universal stress UspA family protein